MVALQVPFGVQVLIQRPAPGAHISTGPPRIDSRRMPFKGGVGGSEKAEGVERVEQEMLRQLRR